MPDGIPRVRGPAIAREISQIGAPESPARAGGAAVLGAIRDVFASTPTERAAQAGILRERAVSERAVGPAVEAELASLSSQLELQRNPDLDPDEVFGKKLTEFRGTTTAEAEQLLGILRARGSLESARSLNLLRTFQFQQGGAPDPIGEVRADTLRQVRSQARIRAVQILGRRAEKPEDEEVVQAFETMLAVDQTRGLGRQNPWPVLSADLTELRVLVESDPQRVVRIVEASLANVEGMKQRFGDEFSDAFSLFRALSKKPFKKARLFGLLGAKQVVP